MNPNKMTEKTQEAIQNAQNRALKLGHVEVDCEHLLAALLDQQGGLIPRLLEKIGVAIEPLARALEKELNKRPSVSGPGVEAGRIYVTQRMNRLLLKAEEEANHLKDEFISVEHILLALCAEKDNTPVGRIFNWEYHIFRQLILHLFHFDQKIPVPFVYLEPGRFIPDIC